MKTLKNIAFTAALVAWAWLGLGGLAAAQVLNQAAGLGESCDVNQGQPCNGSVMHNGGGGIIKQYCGTMGSAFGSLPGIGEYECLIPADGGRPVEFVYPAGFGSKPNAANANPGLTPLGIDCSSGATTKSIYGTLCCAEPGDVLTYYFGGINPGGSGYASQAQLYCDCPSSGCVPNANRTWGPGIVGIDGGCPSYYPFDGGGPCPDQPWTHYSFFDAGTNPLGGPQHLMKVADFSWDAGSPLMPEPLGFFEGTMSFDPTFPIAAQSGYPVGPAYVCTMPYYYPDGGLLMSSLGTTHQDLLECSGSTTWSSTTPFYPCCGDEHGLAGIPGEDLCRADANGVDHCVCIQDGQSCDQPRLMEYGSFTGGSIALGSMGECCSPGLDRQVYVPGAYGADGGSLAVITVGQGWCRPDSRGLTAWDDGGPEVVAGSRYGKGYCNCLPPTAFCSSTADCCAGICTDGGMCCAGSGNSCGQNSDCCGGYVCFDGGPTRGGFCT